MNRFVEEQDRRQDFLLPPSLDDYVCEDNPVWVVEAFIGELDLLTLGFIGVTPAQTGRPAYRPSTMLKIYLYGYLNRTQSSRRLEREAQRNVELMWLTGRLAPDFKTIANFRREMVQQSGRSAAGSCCCADNCARLCTRYDRCPTVFFFAIAPAATVVFWLWSTSPDPKSLERDPQVEWLLRKRLPELEIRMSGEASMSHDLQEWLGILRNRGLGR